MNQRKRNKGEITFLLALTVFSLIVFSMSVQLFQTDSMLNGSGFFPLIVTGLMVLMIGLTLLGLRHDQNAFDSGAKWIRKIQETVQYILPGKMWMVFFLILFYAFFLNRFGFLVTTYLYLCANMFFLKKEYSLKNGMKYLLYSGILLAFIWIIFKVLFRVVLP